MEMEQRGEQSISLSMSRIAEEITSAVTNRVKDGDTESLIRKFLQSGINIGGIISQTKIGTPQGNLC